MTPQIVALVLLAAALHASWNALLRGGADRFWSMAVMCLAIALVCGPVAAALPAPAPASWLFVVGSGLLHVGYNLFLVRTYRSGDLGQTYPIARGTSPVLVTIGAAIFAGEIPSTLGLVGVALVCGGILSLVARSRLEASALGYAIGTGCFIASYSVVDGMGARRSGVPVSYAMWMCLVWTLSILLVYAAVRGWPGAWTGAWRGARETLVAAGGGVISLLAYAIVILAMASGPMGPVSALRETSVVFAALLGWLFLHERLTPRRLVACAVIAAGALCLG